MTSVVHQTGRYVADLFSGAGGVAESVRKKGFEAREWDIRHGVQCDLTRICVLLQILRDILRSLVIVLMMATPCVPFSAARDRTNVIRTPAEPWGVTGAPLSDKEQESLNSGDKCFRATRRIMKCGIQRGAPLVFENPATSKIFYVPELQMIMGERCVGVVAGGQCQDGRVWRKNIKYIGYIIADLESRLGKRFGGPRGFLSRTKTRNIQLIGRSPFGMSWARVAQVVPPALCRDLAFYLLDELRALWGC